MSAFGNTNKNLVCETLISILDCCPITIQELFEILSYIMEYYPKILDRKEENNEKS